MPQRTEVWPHGRPAIGDIAQRSRTVTAKDIELFTAISGDRNPLHYDPDVAAATPFGQIVVQGGISTGVLNAVIAEDLPGPGTVFLHVDWNFRAPVRPGDVITGRVEVIEIRSDKPITKLATTVTRQDEVVAVDGEVLCYTMPLPCVDGISSIDPCCRTAPTSTIEGHPGNGNKHGNGEESP
jgi:acyl dehydratase